MTRTVTYDETQFAIVPIPFKLSNSRFIQVSAEVRYWDDAFINGIEDTNGEIPLRNGDLWEPIIDIETGTVQNWPEGIKADIHYKVCDQGLYWLLDESKRKIAQWNGDYVPNDFLCHGNNGHGDYIIFIINENGMIEGWNKPNINEEKWTVAAAPPYPESNCKEILDSSVAPKGEE